MKRRVALALCTLNVLPLATAKSADMSAETAALLNDVTQPYATDKYVPPPDRKAIYDKTREILRKENLLGGNRPAAGTVDLGAVYGNPLALGTSMAKVLPEVGDLHGAALQNNREHIRKNVHAIYQKLGRKVPEGAELEKIVDNVVAAAIANGGSGQELKVEKPDYQVDTKYSPGSGTIDTTVRAKDENGQPFRAKFGGQVTAKPANNGKGLELAGNPDDKPKLIDGKESKRLAELITGDWTDGDGKPWKIEPQGGSIKLTSTGMGGHPVVYNGTYDLGEIKAEHKIDHPDDMTEDLPQNIKAELANKYHPPFKLALEASEKGDEIKGTFTSLHVTYSPMGGVESVHDPYDRPLVLTRKNEVKSIRILLTDRDFKPIDEVPVYVIPRDGSGGGEIWVEVRVPRDNKDYDDGRVDSITVHLKSNSDPAGVDVNCVETSASSRVLRSQEAVELYPVTEEVTP